MLFSKIELINPNVNLKFCVYMHKILLRITIIVCMYMSDILWNKMPKYIGNTSYLVDLKIKSVCLIELLFVHLLTRVEFKGPHIDF